VRRERQPTTYVHTAPEIIIPDARIYTDLSYFTSDPTTSRRRAVFNSITGYADRSISKDGGIAAALRKRMLRTYSRRDQFALHGKPGTIWLKMNSLVDPDIIDALYEASQPGFRSNSWCAGSAALRPGIPGLSENIRVKSIIGRSLEHAGSHCSDGQDCQVPRRLVYLIPDMMPRNLDRVSKSSVR